VDLTAADDKLCAMLNDEERERAGRLLSERDRRLWMRSRGTLRALLGRYLDQNPRTLRFGSGPHGKPCLLDTAPDGSAPGPDQQSAACSRVSFNLSHSADVALYAVAAGVPVGVDVEVARRAIDEVALAARTFGQAEAERLRELDPDARRSEFLRAWVRHEAQLKCLGVGIGGADAIRDQEGAGRGDSRPWVAQLDVGTQTEAAVAVDAAPQELHCWEWQGPVAS
jgi:4'-phosphopantetheinyl transferase